jgi:CRISPR/Cas system CSM-associated protein Csm3 (group 7 of RAMP superfamily)
MSRYIHLARIVLEAQSPLSIGSGQADAKYDVLLVRDVNGLPMLPATAIAGVLRDVLMQEERLRDDVEELMGAARAKGKGSLREKSRLSITSALLHASDNQAVDGLLLRSAIKLDEDPVLRMCASVQPIKRDHVKLDVRHVASDTGKYDRGAVPRGARFTFDLVLRTQSPNAVHWDTILDAIQLRGLVLGGAVRRGYGQLSAVSVRSMSVDLASDNGVALSGKWPRRLDHSLPTEAKPREPSRTEAARDVITVRLEPEDFWRIGGGKAQKLDNADTKDMPVHAAPYRETKITWANGKGVIADSEVIVVPGSSIKGALRHRTVFHTNRLSGQFAAVDGSMPEGAQQAPQAVDLLFGYVADAAQDVKTRPSSASPAMAGLVAVADAVIDADQSLGVLQHNGIDRLAGGVREGILFSEQLVFKGKFDVRIRLLAAREGTEMARKAFAAALNDLVSGRLAIGAASAKGHGYMSGRVLEPDVLARWVETERS